MGLRNWIRNKRKVLQQDKVINTINEATMFDTERGSLSMKDNIELQQFLNKVDEHVKLLQKEVIDMPKESEENAGNTQKQKVIRHNGSTSLIHPVHKTSDSSNVRDSARNVHNRISSAREVVNNGYPYMFYPSGQSPLLNSSNNDKCENTGHSLHDSSTGSSSSNSSCDSGSSCGGGFD